MWGVKWQALYPGVQLMPATGETRAWSSVLGLPVYEALIETSGHNISLVFSDLEITVVEPGLMPFVVPEGGPDGKRDCCRIR